MPVCSTTASGHPKPHLPHPNKQQPEPDQLWGRQQSADQPRGAADASGIPSKTHHPAGGGQAEEPWKEDRLAGAIQLEKLSSEHHEIQNLFREAGAIRYLVIMLGLTLQEAEMGVRAIINLVCNNHENKEAVREEGGIPPLVTLTHLKHDNPITRWAVWATGALASNNPTNQDAIRAHGGIPPMVKLLVRKVDDQVATEAAIALVNLAYNNMDNQDAIREAGGVHSMVQLLKDGRSQEATVQTLWSLNCLVVDNVANKETIREAGGLPRLVDLLRVR
eukprot:CAMPEP_0117667308 /NCGR_PEP_ID=MMETSP0804-20121206/10885_1 /TAXON_ID=1074897 /ORGANISM="Tetraselmis astigmatica, Strain CCMP880" /LENGTH=276 /DNA_ID=CAMNT_0005475001 /DNA_START=59 /DNA_END=890 /DNA_ORIENTATION=+